MKDYKYTRTTSVKKSIAGTLDAEAMTITTDEAEFDILEELKDFNGAMVSIVISTKSEDDLSD